MVKYRKQILTSESLEVIQQSFRRVAEQMDFKLIEFNGEAVRVACARLTYHVHAVIEYPPKLSVSTIVNHLKGVSSRMYGKAGYKNNHGTALWSPSYFSSSVGGAPLSVLKKYVTNQRTPK